jgi:hypothetical protein
VVVEERMPPVVVLPGPVVQEVVVLVLIIPQLELPGQPTQVVAAVAAVMVVRLVLVVLVAQA